MLAATMLVEISVALMGKLSLQLPVMNLTVPAQDAHRFPSVLAGSLALLAALHRRPVQILARHGGTAHRGPCVRRLGRLSPMPGDRHRTGIGASPRKSSQATATSSHSRELDGCSGISLAGVLALGMVGSRSLLAWRSVLLQGFSTWASPLTGSRASLLRRMIARRHALTIVILSPGIRGADRPLPWSHWPWPWSRPAESRSTPARSVSSSIASTRPRTRARRRRRRCQPPLAAAAGRCHTCCCRRLQPFAPRNDGPPRASRCFRPPSSPSLRCSALPASSPTPPFSTARMEMLGGDILQLCCRLRRGCSLPGPRLDYLIEWQKPRVAPQDEPSGYARRVQGDRRFAAGPQPHSWIAAPARAAAR